MRDHKLTPILLTGLLALTLLGFSAGATTRATVRQDDAPLTPQAYFPFVARSYIQVRYPSDVDYEKQWALEQIKAPGAWFLSTGEDIVIAVVDTGVDLDHPDLSSKLVSSGWHFLEGSEGPGADDNHWHGTHVAGIAAAATDNGTGIAGTGWNTLILPLKVLAPTSDGQATGRLADIADGIYYATDHGAHVINLSLGGVTDPCCYCPQPVQDAATYAYNRGVLVVAAAGNSGDSTEMFPANCSNVIGVAATSRDDTTPDYSSYGTHVSVSAPGGDDQNAIYSTVPDDSYAYSYGTSMSTPHVSGLAALVLARYPTYTPEQVASAILDNAIDLGATGWDQYYGCGRIDAYQSVLSGAHSSEPLCLQGITAWAQEEEQEDVVADAQFAPGEIIVRFRAAPDAAASLASRYALTAEHLPTLDAWRLHVPIGQEHAVRDQLRSDPDVLHADLNYLVFAQN